MRKIAVTNQKGGVGKTTLAFNLSSGLASMGYKVLVIDCDPQGNITVSFIHPKDLRSNILSIFQEKENSLSPQKIRENLWLAGANIHLAKVERDTQFDIVYRLREALENLKDSFEWVFFDCPPSLGYLTLNALNAADTVLIPIQPSYYPLEGTSDLIETITKVQKRLNNELKILGFVLTLFDTRTTLSREVEETLRKGFKNLIFDTKITKSVKLEEAPAHKQSIFEYAPKSKSVAQFQELVEEFLERMGEKGKRYAQRKSAFRT